MKFIIIIILLLNESSLSESSGVELKSSLNELSLSTTRHNSSSTCLYLRTKKLARAQIKNKLELG